jgi:hypothetical protein
MFAVCGKPIFSSESVGLWGARASGTPPPHVRHFTATTCATVTTLNAAMHGTSPPDFWRSEEGAGVAERSRSPTNEARKDQREAQRFVPHWTACTNFTRTTLRCVSRARSSKPKSKPKAHVEPTEIDLRLAKAVAHRELLHPMIAAGELGKNRPLFVQVEQQRRFRFHAEQEID